MAHIEITEVTPNNSMGLGRSYDGGSVEGADVTAIVNGVRQIVAGKLYTGTQNGTYAEVQIGDELIEVQL